MDFMSDGLFCGRRFRTFNVVDDFNREALAIEIDLSLPAQRVIRVLERLVSWRGQPQKLRMDNLPEFISIALAQWAEEHGVELDTRIQRRASPRLTERSDSVGVFGQTPRVGKL